MITGKVSSLGIPIVVLDVVGQSWEAVIDTGFNGGLELPLALKDSLLCRYMGRITSQLAGGQQIEEDAYLVEFAFDGQTLQSEATFVSGDEILIGTQLLRHHYLEINFPRHTIVLRRA